MSTSPNKRRTIIVTPRRSGTAAQPAHAPDRPLAADQDTSRQLPAGSDYEVGYGKPPKTTRFPKGKSGNPKGRPKGARSFKNELLDAASERIPVREGGREKKMTARQALIKTLFGKALKGDLRAATLVISHLLKFDPDEPEAAPEAPLTEGELDILKDLEEQLTAKIAADLQKNRGK